MNRGPVAPGRGTQDDAIEPGPSERLPDPGQRRRREDLVRSSGKKLASVTLPKSTNELSGVVAGH